MVAIKDLFGTLFRRREDSVEAPSRGRQRGQRRRQQPDVEEKPDAAELNQFADRVRQLLQTDDRKVVGSFQFLTLAKTKARFGKKWARIAPKVYSVVESTMEARLGSQDCYARVGNASYVVVFSHLEEQAAAMKAALIANEISRKLFGEVSTSLIQVGVAELDKGDADKLSMMKPLALARALARKVEIPINVSPDADAEVIAAAQLGAPVDNPDGDDPTTMNSDDKNTTRDEWLPPEDGDQALDPVHGWVFEDPDIEAAPEWKHYRETHDIPNDLHFAYFPAWLVRREMIAAHSCVPVRLGPGGLLLTGGAAMPARRRAVDNFAVDTLALMKVCRDIGDSLKLGMPSVIVVPVHIETISIPRLRNSYVETAAGLSDIMRRQLVFEITGVSDETPTFTFAKIADTLRPFCRDMVARVRLETRNFEFLHNVGVHSVGVDLGNLPYSETRTFPLMYDFNERAQKSRMNTFVHGLKTRSAVSGAVAAGFRYLDGPIIATPVPTPEYSRPWMAKDVYASFISELASSM